MNFHPEVLTAVQRKILRWLGPPLGERHFYLGSGRERTRDRKDISHDVF